MQMGKTPSRKNLSLWKNGDTPWVSISDMNVGKFISETKELLPSSTIQSCNIPIVPSGTVLMSFKLTIGKTCIAACPLTTNEAIMAFYPKQGYSFDKTFLYYFLPNLKWKSNRAVKGKTINKKVISQKVIVFPPIQEQQGIAAELDAVQRMIDGYKAQIKDLDELAKSIFFDMFGDPISNPKEWKTDKLVNLVSKDCPITYGIVQPGEDVCNGIPIVRPVDLLSTFISKCSLKKVSKDISDTYKRTILKGDEVLMCVRGTTGIVSLARNDLAGCNVTRGIVPLSFDKISRWFAYWCIKSPQMNFIIQKYTKGATLKQINIKDVRNLVFPVPPFALQQRFAAKIEAIEKQKELLRQQLSDAETLMAERMQYYFS